MLSLNFGIRYFKVIESIRMQLSVIDLVSSNDNILLIFKLTPELESKANNGTRAQVFVIV